MKKKKFIQNVLIMSSSMLIIRIMGMASNIYISSIAGSDAMGVYHLIFSVFTFGITFASSGTGFAVTRLVSEGRLNSRDIIRKCLTISLAMSFVGFAIFFFGAEFINARFIRTAGSENAIRLLSVILPFMGISSVIRGYFIAERRALTLTVCTVTEEAVGIVVTLFLLKNKLLPNYMCPIAGCASSTVFAVFPDVLMYIFYTIRETLKPKKCSYKDIFSICVPIALGSYLRTGLVTVENLMIPLQFAKYGVSNPVGEYGIIKAMAMPVMLFPTVFIQAFSSMLVPEMSEMNAKKYKNGIRYVSSLSLNTTTMFAFFIALMLFKHHRIIAESFFEERGVSSYLKMISLLCVPMYMDTVADSILKGLNLQNASLRYNIIDSMLRVTAIFVFMPRYGPHFYICMLYISEIFNLTLSLGKASRVTGLKIDFVALIIKPAISACVAWWFSSPIAGTLVYIGMYKLCDKINLTISWGRS